MEVPRPEPLGSSLEIQLEAKNLPNMDFASLSDPFAVIDIRENGDWEEFGKCSCGFCLLASVSTLAYALCRSSTPSAIQGPVRSVRMRSTG